MCARRRRIALAALHVPTATNRRPQETCRPQENVEGHPNLDALCFSIPTMTVVVMVVVVMMMTVPPRPDPDVNAGTVMVMMVVMTDHNLSGLNGACLGQSGIVGF
jgi:hypothetical protein